MQPAAELGSQQGQSLRQQCWCQRGLAVRRSGEEEAPGAAHVMIDGEVSEARPAPGPENPQSLTPFIAPYPCTPPPLPSPFLVPSPPLVPPPSLNSPTPQPRALSLRSTEPKRWATRSGGGFPQAPACLLL